MAQDTESFNNDLYNLLKVRGYKPVPLNSQNQRVGASQEADVIEFTFTKDGEDYGKVWISIDNANVIKIYFDDSQQDSPTTTTPGKEYDDTWTGLLKFIKVWAQRRQMSFELTNKDRLGDDMRQRDYFKMKEKLGEGSLTDAENYKRKYNWCMRQRDLLMSQANRSTHDDTANSIYIQAGDMEEKAMKYAEKYEKLTGNQLNEGYYPMGKKASYNDAVPNVKIVLQHNRSLEEGEQRYRNVAKIYLENVDGERFLAPTTKPGIARVYARHIAEGGLPNDDRWNHIKSICEDYNKMAGFVRATRTNQFNESAQELVNEGINHYQGLRETLSKLTGHRGYQAYFESWTPSLMEDALDESINELFVQENIDPRIENAMPILSRLKKPTVEMAEVSSLAEWADGIISEKLEIDEVKASVPYDPSKAFSDEYPKVGLGKDQVYYSLNSGDKVSHKQFGSGTVVSNPRGRTYKVKFKDGYKEVPHRELTSTNKVDEVLDTRDAKMSYAKKNMDSHQNAVSTYHKSTDPDEKKAADKTAMKRLRGMNTFVNNKVSTDDLDESRRGSIQHADWFDVRKMSDAHMDKLDDLTLGTMGPGQYLEYGENHGLPEYVVGIHSGLKNADRTYEHLMRYAKPFKYDVTEGKTSAKPTFKVIDNYTVWNDSYLMRAGAEYDETEIDGKLVGVAASDKGVYGLWYNKAKFGTFSPTPFKTAVAYSEADPNWPYDNNHEDDVYEDLDANQKRAGQLGPTEKVKNNNIGKLVGANESTEIDPELARIIEMAKFKR
jgi:hypothetical protein